MAMSTIVSIYVLLVLSIIRGQLTAAVRHAKCFNDTNEFATKVKQSSFVVYGKATGKSLNEGSDSTFHVAFRVDCILKGQAISKYINITDAGKLGQV
jgi:hypothetical protein